MRVYKCVFTPIMFSPKFPGLRKWDELFMHSALANSELEKTCCLHNTPYAVICQTSWVRDLSFYFRMKNNSWLTQIAGLLAPFPSRVRGTVSEKQALQLWSNYSSATRVAGKVSPITAGIILSYSAPGKLLPNGTLSPPFNIPFGLKSTLPRIHAKSSLFKNHALRSFESQKFSII